MKELYVPSISVSDTTEGGNALKAPRKSVPKTPKKPTPKKRLRFDPPPALPAEIEELFATSDFVELEYRKIEKLRAIKKRNPEQNQRLAEHDATEKRMEEDPHGVMREAHEALDHGTNLLLKLIRSRKLAHREIASDGSVFFEDDGAFSCLWSRLDYLNVQLVRLADKGVPGARSALFFEAKALTEAFIRLAQAHPGDFISSAKSSLTMPSLRSRNPKFTADAEAIGEAIHLAEEHPAGMMTDDKDRLGELCGHLISVIMNSIAWERQQYQWEVETLERLQNFSESSESYRGVTIEEYIRHSYHPRKSEAIMVSGGLPEFSDNPKMWWEGRIKPTLRENFDRLKQDPTRNAALWTELCRSTDNGTDGAKWKVLSDNCRNKVNQLARRAGAKTFV